MTLGSRHQAATVAIALLGAAFLLLHGLNRVTFDVEVLRIGEQTVWTWLSSMLFAASALCALGFMALQRRGTRFPWFLVAGLMLVLSVDEVAVAHERLEAEGGSDLSLFVLQPLVAIGAVALFVRLLRGLERDERVWLVLAAGALVLAQAGSMLDAELQVHVALDEGWDIAEELLEMLVPAFVLAATLPELWRRVEPALRGGVPPMATNPAGRSPGPGL